jgi:hypothetical protein
MNNNRKSALLKLIDEKLAQAKSTPSAKRKSKPTPSTKTNQHRAKGSVVRTKADTNRANGKHSTGPKSDEGKAKAAQNSLKHGYFAAAPQPQDSTIYQALHHDLRMGLQPDGPVEEHLIKELAMFSARLQRLESAEYALISANIESNPIDPIMGDPVPTLDGHQIAANFAQNAAALDQLHKIEVHLRRAYNRTWDRLAAIQKERHKLPLDESLKRSQIWLTAEAIRNNRPQDIPRRHPGIDEKGKLIKHEPGHPLYRPNEDDDQVDAGHPSLRDDDTGAENEHR